MFDENILEFWIRQTLISFITCFQNIFLISYNTCFPLKVVTIKKNCVTKPWFDKDLVKKINKLLCCYNCSLLIYIGISLLCIYIICMLFVLRIKWILNRIENILLDHLTNLYHHAHNLYDNNVWSWRCKLLGIL